MKKLAFLIFIAAITIGICISFATGNVGSTASWLKFNIGGIKGSGNVITQSRDLPKFTGIDFGGAMNVEIVAQKSQSVEIETDDNIMPLITTEVKGDTLYISNSQVISWRSPVKVRISVEDLDSLNVSGASKANATNIKADTFKLDVSGASKIKIEGEAEVFNADLSGASKIDAQNLKAARVNTNASGACKISVFATETLDANTSGASKVSYSGNPKTVNKSSSGAGSVTQN